MATAPTILSCARYRVVFEALDTLDLPAYLGSTLRGAFGHAFRAIACPAPRGQECPAPAQCPYHLIFETSPPPGSEALRTHEEIPRPFVIAPIDSDLSATNQQTRRQFQPGNEVSFELVLIGRAQEFFPYFVVALREVDRLGRGRRAVELRRIDAIPVAPASLPVIPAALHAIYEASENLVHGAAPSITLEDCAAVPMPQGPLTIEFLTQTRLKHEGRFVKTPEFQILFRRLLGRLSSLSRFHCGAPLDVDFRGLIDEAASIRMIRNDTEWTRWQRYSSRQDRRMEWEGIVGRATYQPDPSAREVSGQAFRPFWKFLKFGEFAHVGHGTTFGLGKYRMRC